jgi:hypothetical protein
MIFIRKIISILFIILALPFSFLFVVLGALAMGFACFAFGLFFTFAICWFGSMEDAFDKIIESKEAINENT